MIRQLGPPDASAIRQLRHEALEREPQAFSSSPEEDRVQTAGMLKAYLNDPGKALFGTFDAGPDPRLIGMAGVMRESGAKSRHKVRVWGVYVAPSHRGSGLGRGLMEAVIRFAAALDGVTQLHLAVAESGAAARAVYERVGFRTWGTEPDAMRVGDASVAEHHMVRRLGA